MFNFADLSLFSTKTLVETNGDHQVEVRTQVNLVFLVFIMLLRETRCWLIVANFDWHAAVLTSYNLFLFFRDFKPQMKTGMLMVKIKFGFVRVAGIVFTLLYCDKCGIQLM